MDHASFFSEATFIEIGVCKARLGRTITLIYYCSLPSGIFLKNIYVQVQSSIDRTAVPAFSPQQRTTKVALVKATKHKANPATMRFVWRTETVVLPDHKVAITKQFKDC